MYSNIQFKWNMVGTLQILFTAKVAIKNFTKTSTEISSFMFMTVGTSFANPASINTLPQSSSIKEENSNALKQTAIKLCWRIRLEISSGPKSFKLYKTRPSEIFVT